MTEPARNARFWGKTMGYTSLLEDIQTKIESHRHNIEQEIHNLNSDDRRFSVDEHLAASKANLAASAQLLFEIQGLLTDPSLGFDTICQLASTKNAHKDALGTIEKLGIEIGEKNNEIERLQTLIEDLKTRNDQLARDNKNKEDRIRKRDRKVREAKRSRL